MVKHGYINVTSELGTVVNRSSIVAMQFSAAKARDIELLGDEQCLNDSVTRGSTGGMGTRGRMVHDGPMAEPSSGDQSGGSPSSYVTEDDFE